MSKKQFKEGTKEIAKEVEKTPETISPIPQTNITLPQVYSTSLVDVAKELVSALNIYPRMNSAHEGFAVIYEEMDELKSHVWVKQSDRLLHKMRKEAIQVAAMAIRFSAEVTDEVNGRK